MELFIIAAFAAWLGSVGMGTNLGYSSPAIPSLQKANATDALTINDDEKSWFGSLLTIGALIGGLLAGFPTDIFGRKKSLILSGIGLSCGWVVIATAKSVVMLCSGRVIAGFFTGLISLVVPVYVSETSRPDVRGSLGAGIQLSVTIGILAVYIFGIFLSWSSLALVATAPTCLMAVMMLFMVESPRWLLIQGRREDALNALKFLYSQSQDHEAECRAIEDNIKMNPVEKFKMKELLQPFIYKPILISVFLMVSQQLSGINAVMFYALSIFADAGTDIRPEICMVIIGVVQVVATLVATMVMDKGGRRVMLLISVVLLGISLAVLGGYHYMKKTKGDAAVNDMSWLPLLCLSVFIIGFSCGMGPVPWLMMGELLPARVKGIASSICTGVNWGMAFVVTKEFDRMLSLFGAHGTYWFFGVVMALSFIVIFAAVPETKGKTLEEIEMQFRGITYEPLKPESPPPGPGDHPQLLEHPAAAGALPVAAGPGVVALNVQQPVLGVPLQH
ncbi:solute carrier family 2, facilitated glucose transporter member 8-like [Ornithodoros turicata]|uniref:solute carrier family 2, facilitated glucose transporter member 8-like n=1 Tax=Ornithodoros turicata TaxID=34597 RepID=UPI003139108B